MNKIYKYISIIALAALTAACAKESINEKDKPLPEGEESTLSITLNVPGPETKTSLGAKNGSTYPVYWGADDVITLNGTAATSFTRSSGNASATATFKVNNLSAPYNFLYGGVSGHGNQVNFPSTQNYVADGFDPAAMPMYASVTDLKSGVTFSHVGALLKFSLTGSKKIDSVTLTPVDGNKSLSGNFTIGANGSGILNGTLTPASTGTGLIYSFNGHKQLSDEPFEFFIAIPAGTYEGGITLDIVDNASGHMTVTVLDSNSSKTIAAGVVREFENVVYSPNKETNLIQIYDTATLQTFASRVANGEYTLNARLTQNASSINASGIDWTPIEEYKGIFDGNGKTISGLTEPMFGTLQGVVKNLTLNSTVNTNSADELSWGIFAKEIVPSSAIDDIAGLQNCTAKGSITWTPGSALGGASQLGGLVGNNKGGTISGCSNEATVTFADNGTVNGNQPSIGGVVGRTQKGGELKSQGYITNCSNSGTVVCAAKFEQNIYIGGVLGYQVEKAENLSGCTNSGLVKVASTASTGAALHIGGVIGLGKGTIESCSNASEGVVTAEACSVATYVCQGGVVGRLNRETDSYSGLSNAGTINAAAADPSSGSYIGGVVGRCNEGTAISDFTNSGSINYTGSSEHQVFIGGVVATNTTNTLNSCSTTGGTISYTGATTAGNMYIGGIVGYATKEIANCTNAMNVVAGGAFEGTGSKYYSAGGIVGSMSEAAPITSCLNTGNITYSQEVSNKAYSFLGGVAGRAMGNIIDSSNGGTVTWSGKNSSQNPFIGGLVGDTADDASVTVSGKYGSASATNYGNVVINTSTQTNKYFYVGGVAGRARATVTATNAGQINILQLKCTRMYMGGVVGTNSREMGSGNANLADGDITVSGLNVNSDYLYLGGITGLNSAAVTSATNAGDIITTDGSTCKKSLYVGGIVGLGEANISSCTNSGTVSNACPMTTSGSYIQVGGIVGYNNGYSAVYDCHNTGNISNSADSAGYLYIGGVTSESDALVSYCDNTGDVTNSGNSGNGAPICVGGVAGVSSAGITYSSNGTSSVDGGTISNSGASAEHLYIAGVYAYSITDGSLSHSFNKGDVINSGDVTGSSQVWVGGAIGRQYNQTDDTQSNYNVGIASVISNVTNSGEVANNAVCTGSLNMGGIVAEAYGSVDHCTNSGPVKVNANVAKSVYMGGIMGWWQTNSSNSVSYCENTAAGTISIAPGLNIESQIFCSGVIGGEEGKIEATNSHLINRANITLGEDSSAGAITSAGIKNTTYSYISGIGGGSGESYVAYEYCENYGNILFRTTMHRSRVGGVVACAFRSPDHSKCVADIRFYKSRGGNYKDDVGGVIGYYKAESDGTINDILYKGYLNTFSTSPRCYTSGLVGRVNNDAITFTDCKLGGQIRGVGSSPYNTVAFVCCAVAEHEINVTNLIVETGTKRNTTAVTSLSLNKSTTGSVGVLCFGTTSETNGTDLDPASNGTMTNCTIGSISSYL